MSTNKNSSGTLLPQAFTFNASNQQVRTVLLDGEPYFVAKDVCSILGISNHNDAVGRLDDDEKAGSVLPTQFGAKETTIINESGLYHLIFQSRKPEAKSFRKWVTSEVLPALRRTGRYELTAGTPASTGSTLRYPRRGEAITADILHLLWLIGESLHQGDQLDIALELGVARQTVSRVLNGHQRSSKILMALYKRAQANREADRLYHSPREMAGRLLGESTVLPAPQRLPAVRLNGRRGTLGNQNARKQKGGQR